MQMLSHVPTNAIEHDEITYGFLRHSQFYIYYVCGFLEVIFYFLMVKINIYTLQQFP